MIWNSEDVKYGEVFHQAEKEFSAYNFDYANTDKLFKIFEAQFDSIDIKKPKIFDVYRFLTNHKFGQFLKF